MELFRALAALAEAPAPEHSRLARVLGLPEVPDPAAYADLFLFQLFPYASVYLGPEGMMGGEARDRVAGFWRALRSEPPAEPDHVAVLLALYATVSEQETTERDAARRLLWRQSRKALLWEHLLTWLPLYLDKLTEIAPSSLRQWGLLLGEALLEEARELGPPDAVPLHLRDQHPLPDPRSEGLDAFLKGILAPCRSGMVLTRADLARAARELDVGFRAGNRRLGLQALLSQEPDGTLAWLERELRYWAERHGGRPWPVDAIGQAWAARANRAAELLGALRQAYIAEVATEGQGWPGHRPDG